MITNRLDDIRSPIVQLKAFSKLDPGPSVTYLGRWYAHVRNDNCKTSNSTLRLKREKVIGFAVGRTGSIEQRLTIVRVILIPGINVPVASLATY